MEFVSSENISLTDQVTKLIFDLAKAQDHLSVLENDLKVKKAFCALKDKQLEATLGKIKEARVQTIAYFKKSDEYDDKLCALYMEGFDLVCTHVRKHHPEVDLSTLDIEKVEREVVTELAAAANANDVIDGEIDDPIDHAQS